MGSKTGATCWPTSNRRWTRFRQLAGARKGILLFHDIQPSTAQALESILGELKARGFKVVHLVPKATTTTLPEYDAQADRLIAHRSLAAAKEPLASRALTWSQTGAGSDGEILPWAQPTTVTPAADSQPTGATKASNKKPTVPWYKWLMP